MWDKKVTHLCTQAAFSSAMNDYLKYFPKKSFYPNQKEAIEEIYDALSEQKIALFEGACGTGKTLSALVPALHVAKQRGKTVVIATNVHQQMLQFIDEAKDIKSVADVDVIVLKGKLHMCPAERSYEECDVLRENTYELLKLEQNANQEIDDARMRILKERSCGHLLNTLKREDDSFYKWLFSEVRTPEEVAERASKDGTCGYELLKRGMMNADLVICNYHHLLDPEILTMFLSWLGCGLEDIIVIFDEAHNLESAARAHSSLILTERTIERALNELTDMGDHDAKEIRNLLLELREALRETYESRFAFGEMERIGAEWHDIKIREPADTEDGLTTNLRARLPDIVDLIEDVCTLGAKFDTIYRNQYKEGLSDSRRVSHLLNVATFLKRYFELAGDAGYYPLINVRREGGEISGRIELFACIPKNVTKPLFDSLHSAVLMSATLRPFDVVKTTLGIDRETKNIVHTSPFPKERRRTMAVTIPPLFLRNRDDQEVIGIVTSVLEDIIEQSNGNVLIFFPSFSEAVRYKELLDVDVPVFLDEMGVSATNVKEDFFRIGESGDKAVLLSYLWGTLTEGVNYRDDRARVVVIVGVGYPALGDRIRAIQYLYDHEFGAGRGWRYAIETPMIRRVRQAMGRVIRSPEDYGARMLLDVRYTSESPKTMGKYSVYPSLPPEEKEEIIDVAPGKVKYALMNFFDDVRKAD